MATGWSWIGTLARSTATTGTGMTTGTTTSASLPWWCNKIKKHSKPYQAGVFCFIAFYSFGNMLWIHLPNIRPATASFCESCAYLFTSSPFASHKMVIKYLRLSSFLLNSTKNINLSSRLVYCAVKVISKMLINNLSILAPSVWRVRRGMCQKKLCHSK